MGWEAVAIAVVGAIPPTLVALASLIATMKGNREVTKVKREVRAARAEARGATPTETDAPPED